MYKYPRIQSIFKTSKYLNRPRKIELRITIPSILLIDGDADFLVKKRVNLFINRCCKYGYIIDIEKIVDVDLGSYNLFDNNGNVTVNVIISAYIFDPSYHDIIVGCTLIKKKKDVWICEYTKSCEILILTNSIQNHDVKIGDRLNIRVIKTNFRIGIPKFHIITRVLKRRKRKDVIDIKDMTENFLIYVDTNGDTITLPRRHLLKVGKNVQMQLYGNIHMMFNIPNLYRFLECDRNLISFQYEIEVTSDASECDTDDYINTRLTEFSSGDKERMKIKDYAPHWEKFVRYWLNPYELVFPRYMYHKKIHFLPNVKPVSRAFYKMWEVLQKEDLYPSTLKLLITLGDAPGGFTQALTYKFPKIPVITTSLKRDAAVAKELGLNEVDDIIGYNPRAINKNVTLEYMKEDDGNLLKISNIMYMIKKYGSRAQIVACDGALNYQIALETGVTKEVYHTKLALAEILIGIGCLAADGCLIVKIYGRRTKVMGQILQFLAAIFDKVILYKLRSVRIHNSEMFIIAKDKKVKLSSDDILTIITHCDIENANTFISNIFEFDTIPISKKLTVFNTNIDMIRRFLYTYGIESVNRKFYNTDLIKEEQMKYAKNFFGLI